MNRIERPGLAPVTVGLLVAGPVLMALARMLLVPLDDQAWDKVLTQAAAHQNRSDSGWILSIAASGLLAAGAFALAGVLRQAGRARAAAFASVTTALGWAGAAGVSASGMLFSYQGKAADRAAQIQILKDANSGHTAFIFVFCVLASVGYVVLGVGLVRTGVVGKGVAVSLSLGGALTLLTAPGPFRPLLVAAALLLLAGHLLVIRAVGRESASAPKPAWEPVMT